LIETLALEAEKAINQSDATEKNYYRHAVAKNLKIISQRNSTTNEKNKNKIEWNIINNIKRKMETNELTLTKADKGKTLIILTQEEYKQKTETFIQDNQFITINNIIQPNITKKI
jgi:hypothetical protein